MPFLKLIIYYSSPKNSKTNIKTNLQSISICMDTPAKKIHSCTDQTSAYKPPTTNWPDSYPKLWAISLPFFDTTPAALEYPTSKPSPREPSSTDCSAFPSATPWKPRTESFSTPTSSKMYKSPLLPVFKSVTFSAKPLIAFSCKSQKESEEFSPKNSKKNHHRSPYNNKKFKNNKPHKVAVIAMVQMKISPKQLYYNYNIWSAKENKKT